VNKMCRCGAQLLFAGEKAVGRCEDCQSKERLDIRMRNERGHPLIATEEEAREIRASDKVPRRVGIAQKGELVILEIDMRADDEEMRRIVDMLAKVKEETGVSFLVLTRSIRLARIDREDKKAGLVTNLKS
jgi:hypothetical protein